MAVEKVLKILSVNIWGNRDYSRLMALLLVLTVWARYFVQPTPTDIATDGPLAGGVVRAGSEISGRMPDFPTDALMLGYRENRENP